eukprot:2618590-Prymnesium_polylepis.1
MSQGLLDVERISQYPGQIQVTRRAKVQVPGKHFHGGITETVLRGHGWVPRGRVRRAAKVRSAPVKAW